MGVSGFIYIKLRNKNCSDWLEWVVDFVVPGGGSRIPHTRGYQPCGGRAGGKRQWKILPNFQKKKLLEIKKILVVIFITNDSCYLRLLEKQLNIMLTIRISWSQVGGRK